MVRRPQLLEAQARNTTLESSRYLTEVVEAQERKAKLESSLDLTEVADAWNHTYPVRYDALTGEVELRGAQLVMTADGDSLTLRLTGSDEGRFEAAKESVARHVDRVAERDAGVRCVWHQLS